MRKIEEIPGEEKLNETIENKQWNVIRSGKRVSIACHVKPLKWFATHISLDTDTIKYHSAQSFRQMPFIQLRGSMCFRCIRTIVGTAIKSLNQSSTT